MQIVFTHHAHRDTSKGRAQDNPISADGRADAKILGEILGKNKVPVTCIYQGEYLRYTQTVEMLNRLLKVPVYIDKRLNEGSLTAEEAAQTIGAASYVISRKEEEKRIHEFLSDLIAKHENTDIIICNTSGVSLNWFITYFLKGTPIKGFRYAGMAGTVGSVIFEYDKLQKKPYIANETKG